MTPDADDLRDSGFGSAVVPSLLEPPETGSFSGGAPSDGATSSMVRPPMALLRSFVNARKSVPSPYGCVSGYMLVAPLDPPAAGPATERLFAWVVVVVAVVVVVDVPADPS